VAAKVLTAEALAEEAGALQDWHDDPIGGTAGGDARPSMPAQSRRAAAADQRLWRAEPPCLPHRPTRCDGAGHAVG
jgi:hypothetical protein